MRKIELLAPAGSFEALCAAIQNGCDAVYLGGTMFGARAFANNFDETEMQRAIAYAHVYGVRVFVTVNTLIKEDELEDCLAYVQHLQDSDVDALIIQDLGLFSVIHETFPDLELHASTQMHIHNPDGIQFLKEMGAQRVVLPRETPIAQIKEYSTLGMELEVFVQGALCISYSGQCLMSSLTLHRSGNRGECAQSCRMQYELVRKDAKGTHILNAKGKYLLSPKDLNSLRNVGELITHGVTSFKIEGRMKRPEYVALMVQCYRKAIDAFLCGEEFQVDEAMQEAMEKIFNRGFSAGHLYQERDSRLMNFIRPNHMGIQIGTITGFQGDKVNIHLQKDLHQGDGIRILTSRNDEGFTINRIYKNGLLVNHAVAHEDIEIDKTFFVEKGSIVIKTSDTLQLKELQESYQSGKRRIPVFGSFTLKCSEHAILEVMDKEGNHVLKQSESLCVQAHTHPLSKERLEAQLHKTKDTPFDFEQIDFILDEEGILPIREINQMRRDALEDLEHKRMHKNSGRRVLKNIQRKNNAFGMDTLPSLLAIVHTMEQLLACEEMEVPMIFVEGNALFQQVKEHPHVYQRTPRVMKEAYDTSLKMIQEEGGLSTKSPVICDTSCNVTNHEHAHVLFEHGAFGVSFSLESSQSDCIEIAHRFYEKYNVRGNFIYPVYGREELMLSEYCVIHAVEKDDGKKHCGLCKQAEYQLLDLKKHTYPILCDEDCRMHILNESPRNHIEAMKNMQQHHIQSFSCVFTKEDKSTCKKIITNIKKEFFHDA